MDFRQTTQPSAGRPAVAPQAPLTPEHKEVKGTTTSSREKNSNKWFGILAAILLVGIVILISGIALVFSRGSTANEFKYVDSAKYQAVFLSNGQVYFGNINTLNSKYIRMNNVYYLTQGSGTNSSNYSLVKLGCQQIHDPTDQMIINRDQVTFWENLQSDGKVVSSITQFQKQNPKGPDCSQVSNQTQAGTDTSTQGGTATPTGTGTSTTTGTGTSTTTGTGTTPKK
jgi:hypothetical protein